MRFGEHVKVVGVGALFLTSMVCIGVCQCLCHRTKTKPGCTPATASVRVARNYFLGDISYWMPDWNGDTSTNVAIFDESSQTWTRTYMADGDTNVDTFWLTTSPPYELLNFQTQDTSVGSTVGLILTNQGFEQTQWLTTVVSGVHQPFTCWTTNANYTRYDDNLGRFSVVNICSRPRTIDDYWANLVTHVSWHTILENDCRGTGTTESTGAVDIPLGNIVNSSFCQYDLVTIINPVAHTDWNQTPDDSAGTPLTQSFIVTVWNPSPGCATTYTFVTNTTFVDGPFTGEITDVVQDGTVTFNDGVPRYELEVVTFHNTFDTLRTPPY
jgi:hypothetical protein